MKTLKATELTIKALKVLAAHGNEKQYEVLERVVVTEMAKKTPYVVRQGDILVERVTTDPRSKKHKKVPREKGRIILAHGEATGHAHAICELEAEMIELESGERFVLSESGISIQHEEHGRIDLPAGIYKVGRQREYSPEQIRNVLD